MNNENYEELPDSATHLRHKALFVEPLRRPIKEPFDWNDFPTDGNEFIHRVRIEAEAVLPNFDFIFDTEEVTARKAKAIENGRHSLLSHWKRSEGKNFCCLYSNLETYRKQLVQKFPQKLQFPAVEKEKEVCLFLLGSKLYTKIFPNEGVDDITGHSPLLSIVLHVAQKDILIILQYLKDWNNILKESVDDLYRWMYAFLACLSQPISAACREFLEELYNECVEKNKECEKKNQLHLLDTILCNCFSVKHYKESHLIEKYNKLNYFK